MASEPKQPGAQPLDVWTTRIAANDRVALLVGHEGTGLSPDALSIAETRVRIPMATGTDSLNVATATALALHALQQHPNNADGRPVDL